MTRRSLWALAVAALALGGCNVDVPLLLESLGMAPGPLASPTPFAVGMFMGAAPPPTPNPYASQAPPSWWPTVAPSPGPWSTAEPCPRPSVFDGTVPDSWPCPAPMPSSTVMPKLSLGGQVEAHSSPLPLLVGGSGS